MNISLSTIGKLIQMGKEFGFEGQALQDFVKQRTTFEKQQQDIERSERLTEWELEKGGSQHKSGSKPSGKPGIK